MTENINSAGLGDLLAMDGQEYGQSQVERLKEALRWALAELNGTTRYDNDEQRENCFADAEAALASVSSDQDASDKSVTSALVERVEAALDAGQSNITVTLAWLDGYCAAETAVRAALKETQHEG